MLKYFITHKGSGKSDEFRTLGLLIPGSIAHDAWNGAGPSESGHFVIDTLGPGLGVDEAVATQAGGKFLRNAPYGVHGIAERKLYSIKFVLPVNLASQRDGAHFALGMPAEATAIPGLESMFSKAGVRVIGTLGRTFLQFCELSINGRTGDLEILIDDAVTDRRPGS